MLQALEEISARLVGHHLFSATAAHLDTMEVERVHSSNPQAYPVGGRKNKRATAWGQVVLLERRVQVSQGLGELAQNFDDHARMAALGVRSLVNVPVVHGPLCLGVLNFGFAADSVDAQQLEWARRLAPLALAAFIASPNAVTAEP